MYKTHTDNTSKADIYASKYFAPFELITSDALSHHDKALNRCNELKKTLLNYLECDSNSSSPFS